MNRIVTARRRLPLAFVASGATLTLIGLACLIWDIGYGPLTNTWNSGYSREAWQAIVLLTVAGSVLSWLGVVHHPGGKADKEHR